MHPEFTTEVRVVVAQARSDRAHPSSIAAALSAKGYRVAVFEDGVDARAHLADYWADLVLVEPDLPRLSGKQLLAWIRSRSNGAPLPVVFQLPAHAEREVVDILELGADDFYLLPVDPEVQIARLRALLRRYDSACMRTRNLTIGDCILNRADQTLIKDDVAHRLGDKQFALLWRLAAYSGAVVQRQDLLSAVWGNSAEVETRKVDMYISRVRACLKKIGVAWAIESAYACGYRLVTCNERSGAASTWNGSTMTHAAAQRGAFNQMQAAA
jgi:two-component system, OmpR family, phosphate regulon response regulator PhoB